MMAETYLLQTLRAGINSIKQDASQLDFILDALNDTELSAAKQWFSNPKNVVTIMPGFPMETTHLPFIGVTIAEDTQLESQTGIGLDYYTMTNSDKSQTEVRGARFQGSLKGTIYTPDANLIIWLSTVCKWALLKHFDWLGERGFNNINISLGDYEPSPQFLPIFTFARGVFLRGEYDSVFLDDPIAPITSAKIVGEFNVAGEFHAGGASVDG